jgi:hypothetical protein
MITYSKEILYHFHCDECCRWFSIADWKPDLFLTCPFCDLRQEVEPEVNDGG